DIGFAPDDVEKLRSHDVPIVGGIVPRKGARQFACDFLPGTKQVTFGQKGERIEVRYVGCEFLFTHREVYERTRTQLRLAECNRQFGTPLVPWFQPLVIKDPGGWRYLPADYSF